VKRWRDRQVFGWVLIVGFALFGAWNIWQGSHVSFSTVSVVAGTYSLLAMYTLTHLRPGVRCEREALVVRNLSGTYTIPWASIREVDVKAGRGIRVHLEGREEPLSLEAFIGWPAFGRATRIRDELDVARRTHAGEPDGQVVEVPFRGYLALAIAIPVVNMLGVLLVAGVRWLIGH
jgi:hypothetical protein